MSDHDQQPDQQRKDGIKLVLFFDFRDKFHNNAFRNNYMPIHFLIGLFNFALAGLHLWSNRYELEGKHYLFAAILTSAGVLCFYLGWSHWSVGRQLRRIRRGACGGCGYDLHRTEGPTCPECGVTIKTSRQRRGLDSNQHNEFEE